MAYYNDPVGRKKLHTWEKIATVLGIDLTFDERCRIKGGYRELPIEHLEKARDQLKFDLTPDRTCVAIALQSTVDWANEGKGDKDKALRVTIIASDSLRMNDSELAEHFARRKKITPGKKQKIADETWARTVQKANYRAMKRRRGLSESEIDKATRRAERELDKRLRQGFRQRINFLRKDLWRVVEAHLKNVNSS